MGSRHNELEEVGGIAKVMRGACSTQPIRSYSEQSVSSWRTMRSVSPHTT